MRINTIPLAALLVAASIVAGATASADEQHGDTIFHAFYLELGAGSTDGGDSFVDWDLHGWVGTDEDKLWLKSEGEREDNHTEQAEFWAMYSRNVSTFWDVQIGARYDTQPDSLLHGVVGLNGLLPFFIETEAHLFVSDNGDFSARLRHEKHFLFTQRLIVEPYIEANLFAQDVEDLDVGAGLANAEFGLQTRYEWTRDFAPYIDFKFERKFGETSSIAEQHGEDNEVWIGSLGLRLLF